MIDGEKALMSACRNNFPNSQDLRCTRHFHANCEGKLKKLGIEKAFQGPFLDFVFGEDGLVEANDINDLYKRIEDNKELIEELEQCIPTIHVGEQTSFYDYIKSNVEDVLAKMIRNVRRDAGLPINNGNIPQPSVH